MLKKIVLTLLIVASLVALASAGAAVYFWQWLTSAPQAPLEARVYTVERGATLNGIAYEFAREGRISYPRIWSLYGRAADLTQVKAGEYRLTGEESPLEILQLVNSGKVIDYAVTLVEGTRFTDFLAALHNQQKLIHRLEGHSADQAFQALDLEVAHPEGWFFPDTYHYIAGDTDIDILRRAHQRMREVLEQEWQQRAVGLPYDSAYQALIMASIVEKETGVPHERDEIAGVFVRRLQENMRLQTDPTVIYGMGENYDGNITRRDLKTPTAYNTYVIKGLPPTPIAMPGREAIHAALHPADTSALYFVAKGDGTHYFSATLDEHLQAVEDYQKRRRSDYRSAPPPATQSAEPQNATEQQESD